MCNAFFSTMWNTLLRFFNGDSATEYRLPLPEDIYIEVLQRVDDRTLFRCRLVCRRWRDILNTVSFWSEKCKLASVTVPQYVAENRKRNIDYRTIYFKRPFGRNLIKNSSGEVRSKNTKFLEGFKHWKIVRRGGDGFKIEKPPQGCNAIDFLVCFATSYGPCVKEQIIDLQKVGCESWVIDEIQPKITVSEWHTARYDCASTYKLYVALLRNPPIQLRMYPEYHFHGNQNDDVPYVRRQPAQYVVSEYFKTTIVQQWMGGMWEETSHTFEKYGLGVRYILFQSCGKDRQFWRGHYGSKMAKARISITF